MHTAQHKLRLVLMHMLKHMHMLMHMHMHMLMLMHMHMHMLMLMLMLMLTHMHMHMHVLMHGCRHGRAGQAAHAPVGRYAGHVTTRSSSATSTSRQAGGAAEEGAPPAVLPQHRNSSASTWTYEARGVGGVSTDTQEDATRSCTTSLQSRHMDERGQTGAGEGAWRRRGAG